jgi:outer membrane immunogenic protein
MIMRKIVYTALAAVVSSVVASGSGLAADLPARAPMYTKAPAYTAYNWTGFYVGINGGGGWGKSNWDGIPTGSFNTSGGLVGGTLGYNWQTGPWVLGLEGDLDWANINGNSSAVGCVPNCNTKTDWLGTARGRVGYAFDRILPYVTGGLAVGDIKASQTGFAGASSSRAGYALGGGVEFAIAGNWTAKAEYLYVNLGSISCAAGICDGLATNVKDSMNLFRGGLNYRF